MSGPGTPNPNPNLQHRQFGSDEEREAFAKSQDFGLPPEQEAYHAALSEGDAHREKMAGMTVAERHQYMRGLRESINGPTPKKGDLDNPLKKDQPKEPAAPRPAGPGSRNHMVTVRQLGKLARKAKGRR